MAESLPPVKIPRGAWVDLYSSTGLSGGSKITVQNIGENKAILTESLLSPSPGFGLHCK